MLMFRKILSSAAVMLIAFCMNANAQLLQVYDGHNARQQRAMSKIQLNGDEFWWDYFGGDFNNLGRMGMGDKTVIPQEYDAALCITAGSPIGKGKTIKGIALAFPNSKNVNNLKIWISNELPVTAEESSVTWQDVKKEDITGFENANDGVNEIRFNTPYEIDPSKDTWIGYSFTITANEGKEDEYPIYMTGQDAPTHPKGLFVRINGKDSKWEDYEPVRFGDLGIRVLMSGEFDSNSADISNYFAKQSVVKNGKVMLPLNIQNAGKNEIETVTLSVDINGEKQEVTYSPEYSIKGIGTKHDFQIEVTAPETLGLLPVAITVTKVNGQDNASTNNVSNGKLIVVSEKVKHTVVVEEFTGMWCGWCPRGYVALEELRKAYGEDIILVAAHINDELDSKQYYGAILEGQGAPSAHIDRRHFAVDPYYGISMYAQVPMAIKYEIDMFAQIAPEATVKADVTLDENNLKINSEVKFLYSGEADYALGYVLTEDGMTNDEWLQANYFSGMMDFANDELLAPWVDMPGKVKGLVYNDIALATDGIGYGIEGSIPSTVEEGKAITHEKTFDLSAIEIMQNKNNINALVFLFDRETGYIVNSTCVRLPHELGIEGVESDDETSVEIARYTIDGRLINSPERGINIVKYSDGSTKKIVVF